MCMLVATRIDTRTKLSKSTPSQSQKTGRVQQIGSLAFWLSVHVVYTYAIIYKQTAGRITSVVYTVLLVWILLSNFLLSVGVKSRRQPPLHDHESGSEPRRFCKECQQVQYDETKHCWFCNKCVHGWDHHCHFVGTCISRSNHALFWSYLLAQFLIIFPAAHVTISHLSHQFSQSPLGWLASAFFLYIAFGLLGMLFIFHTVLACAGHTTFTLSKARTVHGKTIRAMRVEASRLTFSMAIKNFLHFLTGYSGAGPVSVNAAVPSRLLQRISTVADAACDNQYYSCC